LKEHSSDSYKIERKKKKKKREREKEKKKGVISGRRSNVLLVSPIKSS